MDSNAVPKVDRDLYRDYIDIANIFAWGPCFVGLPDTLTVAHMQIGSAMVGLQWLAVSAQAIGA